MIYYADIDKEIPKYLLSAAKNKNVIIEIIGTVSDDFILINPQIINNTDTAFYTRYESIWNSELSKLPGGFGDKIDKSIFARGVVFKQKTVFPVTISLHLFCYGPPWSNPLYCYLYNEQSGKLEKVAEGTEYTDNNWTKTDIARGGTYIFVTEELSPELTVPNLEPVVNLNAVSAGKNKTKLTWSASQKAEGYLIYAQKNGKYGYCGITSGTSFTDTKALDSDYNFYWVFPLCQR